MATLAIYTRWLILAGCAAVVGCASTVTTSDGTEMPRDEYRAQQQEAHAVAVAEKLSAMIQDCPPDMTEIEASECRWSNALMTVIMPQIASNLTPKGYWQYRAQRRQFWLDVAGLALNNPFTQAFAFGQLSGGGSSSVKITASDQGSINNIDMTAGSKSPFVAGDDNMTGVGKPAFATEDGMAATNDGQIIDGQGNSQQQVGTDPIPGTNFGGAGDGEGDQGDQNFVPNSSTEAGI